MTKLGLFLTKQNPIRFQCLNLTLLHRLRHLVKVLFQCTSTVENQQIKDYSRQFALTKLETKEFKEAKLLLSESVEKNKADHDAYNIMGIISYILDNNYDALQYFTKLRIKSLVQQFV